MGGTAAKVTTPVGGWWRELFIGPVITSTAAVALVAIACSCGCRGGRDPAPRPDAPTAVVGVTGGSDEDSGAPAAHPAGDVTDETIAVVPDTRDDVAGARGEVDEAMVEPPAAPPPDGPRLLQYERDGQDRTAVVYLPPTDDAGRARPLVLALDPAGASMGAVVRWIPAAREVGWVVASIGEVRNGTPDLQDRDELLLLIKVVSQATRVDRRRIVVQGVSGTGCGAYAQVLLSPDVFRGAIVENAHMGPWRQYGDQARPGKRMYLFTRTDDFNAPATKELAKAMRRARMHVQYEELPGGHERMTPEELVVAARWMDGVIR